MSSPASLRAKVVALVLLAASGVVTAPAIAADWVRLDEGFPLARKDFAWVYDSDRQVLVLYGGNGPSGAVFDDTWEFDGRRWRHVDTPNTPGPRQDHALAYDPLRQVVVLFGGDPAGAANLPDAQTWEYDGLDWVQRSPALAPPPRELHRIAFHPGLGEVLLYGGLDPSGTFLLDDTWSWDGTRWAALLPATPPPARFKHAMTTDVAGARVVLFGGDTVIGTGGDDATTWVFDGTDWLRQLPLVSPPARDLACIAQDPRLGLVVLFGGDPPGAGQPPLGDTWTWDGSTWAERLPPLSPTPRRSAVMAYHEVVGGVVLFGGDVAEHGFPARTSEGSDLWRFDGSTWAEVDGGSPPPRWGMAMAWDAARDRVVLYGGKDPTGHRDDTWEHDGSSWRRVPTAATPGGIHQGRAVYSDLAALSGVLLFGGRRADDSVSNELWGFDGTNWTLVPAGSPSGVYSGAFVYDPLAGEVRVFGGNRVVPNPLPLVSAETWADAGAGFRLLATPRSPSPRYRHDMAWVDIGLPAATLLFGGTDALTLASSETWLYDSSATDWTLLAVAPPAGGGRYRHRMESYGPTGAVVMFGGRSGSGARVAATSEFDMSAGTWRAVPVSVEPSPRSDPAMVYDARRARLLLFGGESEDGVTGDTWIYLDDRDGDGIGDVADDCPSDTDPGQEDADRDGVGDACDVCRDVPDPDQLDSDGDCPAAPYATDPACGDACTGVVCSGVETREVAWLRVRRASGGAGDIAIDFDVSLIPGLADHTNLYRGSVAAFAAGTYDHATLPGGAGCGAIASPSVDLGAAVDGGDWYYLAVPACAGAPPIEGLYGERSDGLQRPRVDEPPIFGAPCP